MVRIRISNNEMYKLITEHSLVSSEAPELLQHIYEHGFIFNEFTLIWENVYTYKVKIEGLLDNQNIHVKKIYKTNSGRHDHKIIDFNLADFLNNMSAYLKECKNMVKLSDISKQMIDDTWSADYLPVIAFMQYALYHALNKQIIEKEKTDRVYKSSSRKRKSSPKTEYNLTEVVTHYAEHINHTKHTFTCRCWPVKGHPRHYKSGKVTWIAPYPKGPDKDLIQANRDYIIKEIE